MFSWMEFSLDILHLAGAQSLFTVRLYNTKSSQQTVTLSAQAIQTIIRSPVLPLGVDLLFRMEDASLHLPFKLLSVEVPSGILVILYQWCSKVLLQKASIY